MDDREFERRLEDTERRRSSFGRGGGHGRGDYGDGGGDIFSDLLDDLLPYIVVLGLLLAGVTWLDNQFGWGLLEWVKAAISSAMS